MIRWLDRRRTRWLHLASLLVVVLGLGGLLVLQPGSAAPSSAGAKLASTSAPSVPAQGDLDCNGQSTLQKPARADLLCADVRGMPGVSNANTWGGKFYDNGLYIGHDEPSIAFLSSSPGSGNQVTWGETLPVDPSAPPTVAVPGRDISHNYELSPALWYGMAICDSLSYPQLPCTPNSDANAPACTLAFNCSPNTYPGAGSAFMELQFYPPGSPPFIDNVSCDPTHWCAALNIDSLECTYGYAVCNGGCIEPVNFAFVQTNGVPTGPPSPQDAVPDQTFVPNTSTLLMNPGDKIVVHMGDAPAPPDTAAGIPPGNAFEVTVDDLTTHQSGYMQASAANGFMNTSIVDCSGTPNNFEPEYSTASQKNIVPWAANTGDISTAVETGHFTPCTSVSNPITNYADPADPTSSTCNGPYETSTDQGTAETSDALCYPANDTHTVYAGAGSPVVGAPIANCLDDLLQNGDLDFDGSPYRTEWPTGTQPSTQLPSSFVQSAPTTVNGSGYPQLFFQTDVALSESSCTPTTLSGCTVPPSGTEVAQPGNTAFYPYWSAVFSGGGGDSQVTSLDGRHGRPRPSCSFAFGNVSVAGALNFGKDAQYGSNQYGALGYPQFISPVMPNVCSTGERR